MTARCSFGDAVLAHFLDGEVAPSAAPPPGELAAHLDACPDCQDVLARGRRLDAVLASCSRPEPDRATTDRLLATLESAIATSTEASAAAATPPPRSALRRWAPRAALVTCGFAAALLWQGIGSTPQPDATEHMGRDTSPAVAGVTDPAIASPYRIVLPDVILPGGAAERAPLLGGSAQF